MGVTYHRPNVTLATRREKSRNYPRYALPNVRLAVDACRSLDVRDRTEMASVPVLFNILLAGSLMPSLP